MKGVLVSLPLQDPSVPPFGIALLAAALEQQGISYRVVDANLDFLDFIEGDSPFRPALCHSGPEYLAGFRRLQQALVRASSGSRAFFLHPYRLSTPYWPNLRLVREIADETLWQRWLGAGIVQRILETGPDWVGLSVSFEGQFPAALALGRALKGHTRVVLGGGLFNAYAHLLGEKTPLWDAADAVVLGAGEDVLAGLRETSAGLRPPEGTRARMFRQGWVALPSRRLKAALRPEFRHIPFDAYRAAGRVLPYRVFDRCHWRRCLFCADARYHAHTDRFSGDPCAVAAELLEFQALYGAQGVYFLDAELPGQFALSLADLLRGSGLRWGGNMRMDEVLAFPGQGARLYAGGCRFVRLGLESASRRILSAMQKGISPGLARRVLRELSRASIGVHIYLMQGFPGERPLDAAMTEAFLFQNIPWIDSFNISTFVLYEGSPLLKKLNKNDILKYGKYDFWSNPVLRDCSQKFINEENIETEFFKRKGLTRCFPTTADSILLGEDFKLNYFS